MNGRPLTDAQISRALRAHLPDRASTELRERVLAAAEKTSQQRALPSFLGALSEADPVLRRRSLLIAAALLVALALASVAAVGAMRLVQPDPIPDLSLEPPADVQAFVLSSYERLPQLPPVAFAWHDSGSAKGRVYVDRSGAVRFDRFTSAEATEPSSYTILSDHRMSGVAPVGSGPVWVEQGEEAIGDDPRGFLPSVLTADLRTNNGPGCEMARDPSAVGNGTAASGWRYVGAELVAGRPTHHVACVGDLSLDIDLWLDVETRLILRVRAPLTDDAGRAIPGQFRTREVTEITFGEQPAALFEPPPGVARISADAYSAYLCTRDLPNEERVGLADARSECPAPPQAEATSLPTPTPLPTERPSLGPRPSGLAGPLAWTQASLEEDWPAPVRTEPAGGAIIVPILLRDVVDNPNLRPADQGHSLRSGHYVDPTGNTASDGFPWVDIDEVDFCGIACLKIGLASDKGSPPTRHLPVVGPTEQWMAYGVVFDTNRDGVADWRYGVDNLPLDGQDASSADKQPHRAWRTDLHTGRTESAAGPPYGLVGETFWDTAYPGRWIFGGEAGGGGTMGMKFDVPFYVWASEIMDGRVVATDYAPDVGWLLPSPQAKP